MGNNVSQIIKLFKEHFEYKEKVESEKRNILGNSDQPQPNRSVSFPRKALMCITAGVLLCGCSGGDVSKAEAQDVSTALTANTSSEGYVSKAGAQDAELEISESSFKKTVYYKATKTRVGVYGFLNFDIKWPESANGYDIAKLQRALSESSETSMNGFINTFENRNFDPIRWKKVDSAKRVVEADDFESVWDTLFNDGYDVTGPFPPEVSITIYRNNKSAIPGTVVYHRIYHDYRGCGSGACDTYTEDDIIFDYKNNRVVTFDDLFLSNSKSSILKALTNHPIKKIEFLMDEPKRVPTRFYIENDVCYFVYDKYEIGCGADGDVPLGLRLSELKQYMTDYGKTLLFGML